MASNRLSGAGDYREFGKLYIERKFLKLAEGSLQQKCSRRQLTNQIFSPHRLRRETYRSPRDGGERSRLHMDPINRLEVLIPRGVPPTVKMVDSLAKIRAVQARCSFDGPVRKTTNRPSSDFNRRSNTRHPVTSRNEQRSTRRPLTSYQSRGVSQQMSASNPKSQYRICAVQPFERRTPGPQPPIHCRRKTIFMDDYSLVGTERCSRHGRRACALKLGFYISASVYFPFHRYRFWGELKKPPKDENKDDTVEEIKHDTLGLIQLRRLLPPAKLMERVIFRSPDDGWYYEGMVTLDCKNYMYVVEDGNNNREMLGREEIIYPYDFVFNDLKENDKVLVNHPDYRNSYVPAEVTHLEEELEVKVTLFGQKKAKIPKADIIAIISESLYQADVELIKNLALEWANKIVVARTKTGEYHIGTVLGTDGEDYAKFRIRWDRLSEGGDVTQQSASNADSKPETRVESNVNSGAGDDNQTREQSEHQSNESDAENQNSLPEGEVVEAVHVFGSLTPIREIHCSDYVLAPAEPGCYLPGQVIEIRKSNGNSELVIDVKFKCLKRAGRVDVNECFWISNTYYHNAIANYINTHK